MYIRVQVFVNTVINHITAQTMWQTELLLHMYDDMKTVGNLEYIWEEWMEVLYEATQY